MGFDLPTTPWDLGDRRWICIGTVDGSTASDAVAAVVRGVGLIVVVDLAGEPRRRLMEDLHRAGVVSTVDPSHPSDVTTSEAALLDLLARGETLTASAARLHVSRRTANRWLTTARERFGVTTTAEAVTLWSSTAEEEAEGSRPPS